MSQISANPILHEYNLMQELGISPSDMDDQYVEIPSFKDFIRWVLGKPIKILYKKGISFNRFQSYLAILDAKRSLEQEELRKIKKEIKF